MYASEKDKCDAEIAARNAAISEGEEAKTQATAQYDRCNSAFFESKSDLL